MHLPLAIHQDILYDDSSYKKKLMSFEYLINDVSFNIWIFMFIGITLTQSILFE